MTRQPILTAALALATLAMITLGLAGCASGPPQPSLGARMADMIDNDIAQCSAGSQAACMRYQFDSQAVMQFLAPVPPSAYSLTVNRGFGW